MISTHHVFRPSPRRHLERERAVAREAVRQEEPPVATKVHDPDERRALGKAADAAALGALVDLVGAA